MARSKGRSIFPRLLLAGDNFFDFADIYVFDSSVVNWNAHLRTSGTIENMMRACDSGRSPTILLQQFLYFREAHFAGHDSTPYMLHLDSLGPAALLAQCLQLASKRRPPTSPSKKNSQNRGEEYNLSYT